MPEPTIIFDLDGTILSVNSFRPWVWHLLRRPGVGLIAGAALLIRKLGLMRHETLKWRLQRLWQASTAGDGGAAERALVRALCREVRPELAPVLGAVAAGRLDAVMATAAVADYAEPLGQALGFRHILATPRHRPRGSPSNVGDHKRDSVLAFLGEHGWQDRPLVLFTDHVDDLPLMHRARIVYWFGAEAELPRIADEVPEAVLRPGRLAGQVL